MAERLRIKPARGKQVRKPDGHLLSIDGETVLIDSYWRRRLVTGDVVPFERPVKPAALKTAKTAPAKKVEKE